MVLLSFIVIRAIREVLGIDASVLGWLVRIGIVTVAALMCVVSYYDFKNKQYAFRGNKLIITHGWLGLQKNEVVISIEPSTVKAISLRQGFLEKMLHSGTVNIELDKRSGKSIVRLEHIDDPQKILRAVEAYIR